MNTYVVEVHAGIGAEKTYLMETDKGVMTTTPKFRSAKRFDSYLEGKEQLELFMQYEPDQVRKIVKRDSTFDGHVILLLQCWTRVNTNNPVVSNVFAQRMYTFKQAA